MKMRDSRNNYPLNAYLVFLNLPEGEALKKIGLYDLPSPNHAVAMVNNGDGFWTLYDPLISQVDRLKVHIPEGHETSVLTYIFQTDYSEYEVVNIFNVMVLGAPRLDVRGYGRPMYCHNFLAYLLGLDIDHILTTLKFRDSLLKLNGVRNFTLEVIK